MHTLPVEGAGFFKDSSGSPPAARAGAWADRVAELADRLGPVAAAGILGPTLLSRCRDRLLDATRWDQPCVCVHGDLHPRHVLSVGARVEAIIDWADCAAAPPWLDLARMDLAKPRLRSAMLDGYFPAGIPADASLHLANHHFLYQLLALVWEYEGGVGTGCVSVFPASRRHSPPRSCGRRGAFDGILRETVPTETDQNRSCLEYRCGRNSWATHRHRGPGRSVQRAE